MGSSRQSLRAALICSLLAGCAHITPRDNPPDDAFTTAKSLDAATACVVAALDREVAGVPHAAVAIAPNAAYEVRPQKELVMTGEVYFVRVAADPAGARLETYVISTWKTRIVRAVRACRG